MTSSFHLERKCSLKGRMAGSFQNRLCGVFFQASRSLGKSGAVTRTRVSSGSNFSGGGITAGQVNTKPKKSKVPQRPDFHTPERGRPRPRVSPTDDRACK